MPASTGRRPGSGSGSDTAAVRRATDEWNKANPQPKVTLAQVADHIEHVRKVAGVDHVGIGSDFDGITTGRRDSRTCRSSRICSPSCPSWLERRGPAKLAGENVLRALEQAEAVAKRLQSEKPSWRRSSSNCLRRDRDWHSRVNCPRG